MFFVKEACTNENNIIFHNKKGGTFHFHYLVKRKKIKEDFMMKSIIRFMCISFFWMPLIIYATNGTILRKFTIRKKE